MNGETFESVEVVEKSLRIRCTWLWP